MDLAQLRGIEGAATAHYFRLYGDFLPPEFPFERRSSRPPHNAVNACISFGSALVYQELVSAIHGRGLDPGLGLLHSTENGRWALALDLMFTTDIWDGLLPAVPHDKPPGSDFMLRLIGYDIAEPKRLHRVATVCEDFGVRVQYSLFECWLDEDRFKELWEKLQVIINAGEDRIVAYTLDAGAARRRMAAGARMLCTQKVACYVV